MMKIIFLLITLLASVSCSKNHSAKTPETTTTLICPSGKTLINSACKAPFETDWNLTSSNITLIFQLSNTYTYDFSVDWGDGTSTETYESPIANSRIEHTYNAPGNYTVKILGKFPKFTQSAGQRPYLVKAKLGEVEWQDLSSSFQDCINLTSFEGGDTSNVTNMSLMFRGATGLTSLDLTSFNTSKVTNMSGMFQGASNLTSLNISSFRTPVLVYMSDMFRDLSKISTLDLSNFDTQNVINMSGLFFGASGLTSIDISSFNTSKVETMSNMFRGMTGLFTLNVSSLNTSSVTSMSGMFQDLINLESLNLSNFNTSKVTAMNTMFQGDVKLTNLNLSSFDTAKVTNMGRMFQGFSNVSLNISNFSFGSISTVGNIFNNANNVRVLTGNIDTSSIYDSWGVGTIEFYCNTGNFLGETCLDPVNF